MKTLTVIDSKFGRHRVYASQIVRPAGADVITGEMLPEIRRPNLQLACYALGVLHRYGLLHDYTHVCMVIVQPFLGHTDSYTCTIEELRETEAFLRERAIETRTNPTFRPSAEACRWCKARARCPERAAWVQENAKLAAMMRRDPRRASGALSTEALAAFVDAEGEIKEALAEARAFLIEDYHAGRKVPGKKVVLAQDGHRAWIDKENAERVLTTLLDERAFTRALISPAEAEKRLPRQHHAMLADICAKPPPAPKLVSEHDKRAPMRSLKNRFKDER